ncbi:hypothetical protein D8S78_04655 [Natrialba swarupiae]|nr:hypothetical protein [Natrialba swarupiae]
MPTKTSPIVATPTNTIVAITAGVRRSACPAARLGVYRCPVSSPETIVTAYPRARERRKHETGGSEFQAKRPDVSGELDDAECEKHKRDRRTIAEETDGPEKDVTDTTSRRDRPNTSTLEACTAVDVVSVFDPFDHSFEIYPPTGINSAIRP